MCQCWLCCVAGRLPAPIDTGLYRCTLASRNDARMLGVSHLTRFFSTGVDMSKCGCRVDRGLILKVPHVPNAIGQAPFAVVFSCFCSKRLLQEFFLDTTCHYAIPPLPFFWKEGSHLLDDPPEEPWQCHCRLVSMPA